MLGCDLRIIYSPLNNSAFHFSFIFFFLRISRSHSTKLGRIMRQSCKYFLFVLYCHDFPKEKIDWEKDRALDLQGQKLGSCLLVRANGWPAWQVPGRGRGGGARSPGHRLGTEHRMAFIITLPHRLTLGCAGDGRRAIL